MRPPPLPPLTINVKTGDVSKRNRHANTDNEFQFHMYFKHIFTNKSSITKLPIGSSIPLKVKQKTRPGRKTFKKDTMF